MPRLVASNLTKEEAEKIKNPMSTKPAGMDLQNGGEKPQEKEEAKPDLPRIVVAEFVGTAYLVATIIGSGIMGDNLSLDDGVALLGNTLATWGILFVLITVFGPVSGAHFNPVVTLTFYLRKEIELPQVMLTMPAQFVGGILGAIVAHGMFELPAVEFDGKDRNTNGEFLGEIVATVGLLVTILGSIEGGAKATIPMAVGLYITAGYWFTSSTSFANPAVTVARSFTGTFAGISVDSFGAYFGGQATGFLIGVVFCQWIFAKKSIQDAFGTLVRQ